MLFFGITHDNSRSLRQHVFLVTSKKNRGVMINEQYYITPIYIK